MDLEKIREAAERVAHSEGLEVVDVEWKVGKQRFLRVYIDRPWAPSATMAQPGGTSAAEEGRRDAGGTTEAGRAAGSPSTELAARESLGASGISHRDCEKVSEQLSVILDVEDLVPGPGYILEISSPGLDRKLTKPADYERFAGRRAKLWTTEPVENLKYFEGRLEGYADGVVKISLGGREPRVVAVPFAVIRKANLVVEF